MEVEENFRLSYEARLMGWLWRSRCLSIKLGWWSTWRGSHQKRYMDLSRRCLTLRKGEAWRYSKSPLGENVMDTTGRGVMLELRGHNILSGLGKWRRWIKEGALKGRSKPKKSSSNRGVSHFQERERPARNSNEWKVIVKRGEMKRWECTSH